MNSEYLYLSTNIFRLVSRKTIASSVGRRHPLTHGGGLNGQVGIVMSRHFIALSFLSFSFPCVLFHFFPHKMWICIDAHFFFWFILTFLWNFFLLFFSIFCSNNIFLILFQILSLIFVPSFCFWFMFSIFVLKFLFSNIALIFFNINYDLFCCTNSVYQFVALTLFYLILSYKFSAWLRCRKGYNSVLNNHQIKIR